MDKQRVQWKKMAGWLVFILYVIPIAWGDRDYEGVTWKTLRFKTRIPNRRNSPTFAFPRCVIRTPGVIVLDRKRVSWIEVIEDAGRIVVGDKEKAVSTARSITVDMNAYDTVVILNGNEYALVGQPRQLSRVDPFGTWVISDIPLPEQE
ncbi:MAG: hypothetical protein EOM20_08875 [Spartobacteria bacterium]|nr:hypothetical protein [Spartobacteria bacterium]